MQRTPWVLTVLLLAVTVLVLAGCSNNGSDDTAPKTVTISNVGWYFSNVDPLYWGGSDAPTSAAFVTFQLVLEESNLLDADIAGTTLTSQGKTWTRGADGIDFDEEDGVVPVSNNWTGDPNHVIPLQPWDLAVELTNGNMSSVTREFAPPGSDTVNDSLTHLYTEDYSGTPPAGYVSMIKRATIGSDSADATSITIEFTVDDDRVYNGWIWFYDSEGNYLGRSEPFASWSDGSANSAVLSAFDVTGALNSAVIQEADMEFESATTTPSDIAEAVVVLCDGGQYKRDWTFDFRSISAPIDLTN